MKGFVAECQDTTEEGNNEAGRRLLFCSKLFLQYLNNKLCWALVGEGRSGWGSVSHWCGAFSKFLTGNICIMVSIWSVNNGGNIAKNGRDGSAKKARIALSFHIHLSSVSLTWNRINSEGVK